MDELSFSNLSYLDEQYRKYLADPASLEPSWKHFFEGWEIGRSAGGGGGDVKVDHLIQAYRTYGHLKAHFNCLLAGECPDVPELNLKTYGFSESDLKTIFPTEGFLKAADARLEEILSELEKTYCGSIGIEYMGIQNPEIEKWIQKEIEPGFPIPLTPEEKLGIFHDLNRAELFEMFLHTKYVGQKRFSLEGGETLIPMLTKIVSSASQEGVHEVVLGMAHRGRLNVLANLLNKSYEAIFSEFEDVYIPDVDEGTGDVKYHKGFTGNFGDVSVVLTANPSHLEAVDPVVEGQTRARQELRGRKEVIPILIHGDASVAGQGVVYETLQLSKLVGYQTGGTVHIVINNQIGFTTLPKDGRSTRYCTDIALSFGAPVFHVNAEDPDACVYAALLALKIRQKFHIDVFIDLNCYRKYGHNEGDEPAFTQPQQYEIIRAKKTIRSLYLEKLTSSGLMSPAVGVAAETEFKDKLQKAIDQVSSKPTGRATSICLKRRSGYHGSFCRGFAKICAGVVQSTLGF